MYKKLLLLLVSFALFACAGTSVSMQGKGFAEFTQPTNVVMGYGITWTQCTGEPYRLAFEDSYLQCPVGSVVVMVMRNNTADADAESQTIHIGNTVYTSGKRVDSYEYIIAKPKLSWAELTERITAMTKGEMLFTKAAIDSIGDDGSFVELEPVLAELEKLGFIEDTSIIKDISQMVAIGAFESGTLADGRPVMGLAILNSARF